MHREEQGRMGSEPQQARSRDTRQRLLDAAIDCLVELGYGQTSTTAVLERAGVSRGSMLHQFPSRNDLLLAAMDHLVTEGMRELVDVGVSSPRVHSLTEATEILWRTFRMRYFWASIELWIAARTDPDLRTSLYPQARELGRIVDATFVRVFGEEVSKLENFEPVRRLLLTSMRGVALTYAFSPRDPETEPMLATWIDLVQRYLVNDAI